MAPPKAKPKAKPAKPDEAPKAKPKNGYEKRTEKRSKEVELIRTGAAELLALPAMPAAIKGDQWAVQHFSTRGPALADRIAAEADRNPNFRAVALKALAAQGYTMMAVEMFMYAAPALIHYGLVPNAEEAGRAMGVPVLTKGKRQPRRGGPEPGAEPPFQGRQAPPAAKQAPPPAAEPVDPAAVPFNGEVDGDSLEAELGSMPPPPMEAI